MSEGTAPASPGLAAQAELDQLLALGQPALSCRVLCEVSVGVHRFPVSSYTIGSSAPDAPAVGFFGGVHGLERIGTELVIAYLRHLVMRLRWDETLHRQLEGLRLVFMPLVNPGGLHAGTRANPQGVDLMRNAPVDAREGAAFLVGGQRVSPALPWYRGAPGAPMAPESAALCDLVARELLPRPFSVAVDCHSGFGLLDRIWFPHAHTRRPIARLAEVHALSEMQDQTLLHHRYLMEPQSRQYLAHGDLWDHLCLLAAERAPTHVFLPLTLEMGSWRWIKKNPRQLFSRLGIFNPMVRHRQERVLRRHIAWFDFITRAATSHARWLPVGAQREAQAALAATRWYSTR